jgi:hypothetical protein
MRHIPPGSEADNILVGELDFLDRAISGFVRLSQACHLGDLTEVPVPTRFLFILLGPHSIPGHYHEIGRAMATLMSDEVRRFTATRVDFVIATQRADALRRHCCSSAQHLAACLIFRTRRQLYVPPAQDSQRH